MQRGRAREQLPPPDRDRPPRPSRRRCGGDWRKKINAQVVDHLPRVGIAIGGAFGDALDNAFKLFGDRLVDTPGRRWIFPQHLFEQRVIRLAANGFLPVSSSLDTDAEAEDIRGARQLDALRRALAPDSCSPACPAKLRPSRASPSVSASPKSTTYGRPARIQENVTWLDVAMDQTARVRFVATRQPHHQSDWTASSRASRER